MDGNVSWIESSSHPRSLSSLLENAVTRDTDQVIRGDIVFENDVSTSTVTGEWEGIDEIRDIVSDAVIDDGRVVELAGEKIFKENLATDALSVTNNAEIPAINDINILQFNDTVARKDQDERITGHVSFFQEVAITELLANDTAHELPLKGLVLATETLPPKVSFKNLVVRKDVSLKNLDGIDFDKFLEDRVTTDQNHSIAFDVQFNGVVEVTGFDTVFDYTVQRKETFFLFRNIHWVILVDFIALNTNPQTVCRHHTQFLRNSILKKTANFQL